MIVNNIPQVKRVVTVKIHDIDTGARAARDEMMSTLIEFAKEEIEGKRGSHVGPRGGVVWDKATSGHPPMNRTGNLRRSITGEKSSLGFAHYYAVVGPTMVYSRRVELGGGKWKSGTKFPYMQPAFEKFQGVAMSIIEKHLGQGAIMAAFLPPVIFEIEAKATQAIAQFQAVNAELDEMQASALKAGGSIDIMTKASKYAGVALLGLGSVFAVFGAASLKQLDSVEKAQSNLSTAIKNTGVSYSTAKPYVDAAAASMRNLGFSTEDTYGALSTLTAASGSPKVALETLATAADLARFKSISLTQAGTLLSRATIGQARGLGDLGIAIGKTIPKGADLATILQAVETRAGGAAVAFKTTLAGSMEVAKANFQNLEVQVGTKLLPTVTKFTNWISNTAIPWITKLVTFISDHIGLFQTLGTTLAIIWAVPKVDGILTALTALTGGYTALATAASAAAGAENAATGGAVGAAGGAAVGAAGGAALGLAAAVVGAEAYSALRSKQRGAKLAASLSRIKTEALPSQTFMSPAGTPNNWSNLIKKPAKSSTGLPDTLGGHPVQIISSSTSKASVRKQAKGITSLGSGAQITGTLTINGSGVGKLAAKSVLTGSTLNKGGR